MTWLVAGVIMAVLVWLAIRGIKPSIVVQTIYNVIEYGAIISFVVLALIHELSNPPAGVHGPSWSFFSVGGGVGGRGPGPRPPWSAGFPVMATGRRRWCWARSPPTRGSTPAGPPSSAPGS